MKRFKTNEQTRTTPKRERTAEDKAIDKLMARGIMRLGSTTPPTAEPNAFAYILKWDRMGRQGQKCRILENSGNLAQIEFEDGYTNVINRQALRRSTEPCSYSSSSSSPRSS